MLWRFLLRVYASLIVIVCYFLLVVPSRVGLMFSLLVMFTCSGVAVCSCVTCLWFLVVYGCGFDCVCLLWLFGCVWVLRCLCL